MNKYYTPEIEELHINLDIQIRRVFLHTNKAPDVTDEWDDAKVKWGNIELILSHWGKGWIRVKHLDREDIEGEGFEYIGRDDEFPCDNYNKGIYMVQDWGDQRISIESNHSIGGKAVHFVGKLKNLSEFRRILKQIGV